MINDDEVKNPNNEKLATVVDKSWTSKISLD